MEQQTSNLKVAIVQPGVILGGRLRVILGLAEVLNEAGIVPDLLTSRIAFREEEVGRYYERKARINFRKLPLPFVPGEWGIALFNAAIRHFAPGYDLLINTGNSLIFLPPDQPVLTYLFFPRRARITAPVKDIHKPHSTFAPYSPYGLSRGILRRLYRHSRPHPGHRTICMTCFTRTELAKAYGIPPSFPVVYPPVDLDGYRGGEPDRECAVVTVGRFAADKRQLDQIKLAERMPDVPFHIVGIARNNRYYRRCRDYIAKRQVANVTLHPDLSFENMLALMHRSRFFLHTLVNEPFGLTAVQAVAAGCIPLVHDSGGQRETIPEPSLRYSDLDDVPVLLDRLRHMDAGDLGSLSSRLLPHVEQFDAPVFHDKMRDILGACLDLPANEHALE